MWFRFRNLILMYTVQDRKVYGHVLAAFRYGREDLDVLGLTFRKVTYIKTIGSHIFIKLKQIYAYQSPNLMNLSRVSNPPKTGFNLAPVFKS